ncbi:MAG: MFS transporter [Alphaproteobacteria bacterium]
MTAPPSSSPSSSGVLPESEAAASVTPALAPVGAPAALIPKRRRAGQVFRVFRHRNYRVYFTGMLVSLVGAWMQSVAQGWLVYDLTGSPLLLGVVAFAGQIPLFFGSPFGGAIADRADKRNVLFFTQGGALLQALLLALLTLTGLVEVWHVIVLALLLGVINAVDVPTRHAFIIEMVGRDDLRSAIALNSIMFNIARVIGPSIAGLLVAVAGEGVCFALNAVTYGAVLASLVLIKVPKRKRRPHESPWREMKLGFQYVQRHPQIRTVLLLIGAASFFGGPYLSLMPVFAADVLRQGSEGFGFLMAAIGVGALLGAYTMSVVPDRLVAFMPVVAAATFGGSLIFFSQSHIFWLSLILVVPTAFSLMLQGASTNALIQHISQEHMRGRVASFYSLAFLGMLPWGSLAIGWISDHYNVQLAVALGGAVCIICAALAHATGHLRAREFEEIK